VLIKRAWTDRILAAQPQREAVRLLIDNTTFIMTLWPVSVKLIKFSEIASSLSADNGQRSTVTPCAVRITNANPESDYNV
jgi:hypothetical protein